jgi:hypothetical protein
LGELGEGILVFVLSDSGQQGIQILAGELPLEGSRGRVVTLLEVDQSLLDLVKVREVVGRHNLALYDREEDLHLV